MALPHRYTWSEKYKPAWEVDWTRRRSARKNGTGPKHRWVWARNPNSRFPFAREWHWAKYNTVRNAIGWRPAQLQDGKTINADGYIKISRKAMTTEEIVLAVEHGLFGKANIHCLEHRLRALQKYGPQAIQPGVLVRHLNGRKTDNSYDNLVLGSVHDNNSDHNTAHIQVLILREQLRAARQEIQVLTKEVARLRGQDQLFRGAYDAV